MKTTEKAGGGSAGISDRIREARKAGARSRREGLAALNELFRAGQPPAPPLDGPYAGELLAVDIAPGITRLVEWLTSLWMPWKGKHLSRARSEGDNIFSSRSRAVFRILFPLYKGIHAIGHNTFRAFTFKTSIAPGRVDPDREVLRIDYDLAENPALTIRRILDEVVQVDEGVYLGKIHFKWWWGRWQMIGYFALRRGQ